MPTTRSNDATIARVEPLRPRGRRTDTSGSDSLKPPADTVWERADESRRELRFLVSTNRWLVVGASTLVGFPSLVPSPGRPPRGPAGERGARLRRRVARHRHRHERHAGGDRRTDRPPEQIDELEDRREYLRDEVQFREEIEELSGSREYAEGLVEHGRTTSHDLAGAQSGSFSVLLPVLHYNHSWRIHAVRALRSEYGEDLPKPAGPAFEELV